MSLIELVIFCMLIGVGVGALIAAIAIIIGEKL
jgi:hypothetical protein